MDRRLKKTAVSRPAQPAEGRHFQNNHVLQFTLLVSAGALLLGGVVAWKIYDNDSIWKAWALKVASGKGSGDTVREELAKKSIRYLGGGYADLGVYSVGRYDAITGTTLTVEFRLKGMTPCEDEAQFIRIMKANSRAFREHVSQAVRDCRGSDCSDSKSMGRKVTARVNRAFGSRFLEAAELVDLAVFESVGNYPGQAWQPESQEGSPEADAEKSPR